MVSVTLTISTPMALGRMCLKMIRALLAPEIRAASTNSRSRSERNSPRIRRASPTQVIRPRKMPSARMPLLLAKEANQLPESRRPAICAITAASSRRRDDDDDVGEAHQHRFGPAAEVAGQGPDHDADQAGDEADHHHDGDGLLGAAHGHGEEVAADPVLAEGVFAPGQRPQRGGGHAVVDQGGDLVVAVFPPAGDAPVAHGGEGHDEDDGEDDESDDGAGVAQEPFPDDLPLAQALGFEDRLDAGRRGSPASSAMISSC